MSTATSHVLTEVKRTPFNNFLRSPMNWLLIFIPLTIGLEHLAHVAAPVLFFMAAVSIVPIAALIVRSTEQIATLLGVSGRTVELSSAQGAGAGQGPDPIGKPAAAGQGTRNGALQVQVSGQ